MDNLTKDVLTAAKAGMSYGYWKALHPRTKQDDGLVVDDLKLQGASIAETTCRTCGKRFKVTPKFKIVCSEECRKIHTREHNRQYMRRYRGIE